MEIGFKENSFLFNTNTLESAHNYMTDICGKHDIDCMNRKDLKFEYNGIKFRKSNVSLGLINYGSQVEIQTQDLKSYSISLPLIGSQNLQKNGVYIKSTEKKGIILSSNQYQKLILDKECKKIQLVIRQDTITNIAREILNDINIKEIEFDPEFDLNNEIIKLWWQNLINIYMLKNSLDPNLYSKYYNNDLEDHIIKSFILTHDNNLSNRLRYESNTNYQNKIYKVKKFIESKSQENISINDLIRFSNLSKSTLYNEFQKNYKTTPLNYLKKYRLMKIHSDLLNENFTNINISTIAYKWGISHLSRFSEEYKKEYGCTPHETRKYNKYRYLK